MKQYHLHYLALLMMFTLFSCKKDQQKNVAVNNAATLKTESLGGTSLTVSMGGNALLPLWPREVWKP